MNLFPKKEQFKKKISIIYDKRYFNLNDIVSILKPYYKLSAFRFFEINTFKNITEELPKDYQPFIFWYGIFLSPHRVVRKHYRERRIIPSLEEYLKILDKFPDRKLEKKFKRDPEKIKYLIHDIREGYLQNELSKAIFSVAQKLDIDIKNVFRKKHIPYKFRNYNVYGAIITDPNLSLKEKFFLNSLINTAKILKIYTASAEDLYKYTLEYLGLPKRYFDSIDWRKIIENHFIKHPDGTYSYSSSKCFSKYFKKIHTDEEIDKLKTAGVKNSKKVHIIERFPVSSKITFKQFKEFAIVMLSHYPTKLLADKSDKKTLEGFNYQPYSQNKIAEILGISQSYVSQILLDQKIASRYYKFRIVNNDNSYMRVISPTDTIEQVNQKIYYNPEKETTPMKIFRIFKTYSIPSKLKRSKYFDPYIFLDGDKQIDATKHYLYVELLGSFTNSHHPIFIHEIKNGTEKIDPMNYSNNHYQTGNRYPNDFDILFEYKQEDTYIIVKATSLANALRRIRKLNTLLYSNDFFKPKDFYLHPEWDFNQLFIRNLDKLYNAVAILIETLGEIEPIKHHIPNHLRKYNELQLKKLFYFSIAKLIYDNVKFFNYHTWDLKSAYFSIFSIYRRIKSFIRISDKLKEKYSTKSLQLKSSIYTKYFYLHKQSFLNEDIIPSLFTISFDYVNKLKKYYLNQNLDDALAYDIIIQKILKNPINNPLQILREFQFLLDKKFEYKLIQVDAIYSAIKLLILLSLLNTQIARYRIFDILDVLHVEGCYYDRWIRALNEDKITEEFYSFLENKKEQVSKSLLTYFLQYLLLNPEEEIDQFEEFSQSELELVNKNSSDFIYRYSNLVSEFIDYFYNNSKLSQPLIKDFIEDLKNPVEKRKSKSLGKIQFPFIKDNPIVVYRKLKTYYNLKEQEKLNDDLIHLIGF